MSQDYLDKLIEKDKAGTQIQSIPLHDTELRGITIDDPITVEGNPINFSTKNEQNAIQTVVNLEPIQDLHGYSKPWVGGAGKNKLKIDAVNKTIAGLTYTINEDGSFYIDGTGTDSVAWIHLCSANLFKTLGLVSGQRYILSQSISNNAYIYIEDYNNVHKYEALDGSIEFLYNGETNWRVCFLSTGNITYNHVLVQPMIRLSTESDSTFEPYSNICPILPHEEIKIGGCGKNLCKYLESGIINNTTGQEQTSTIANRTSYIDVLPSEYYTLSGFTGTNVSIRIHYFYKDGSYKGNVLISNINGSTIQQMPNDVYYIRFQADNSIMSLTSNIQVEKGQTATSYLPYSISNQLTLPLPENVYGGTLNLETGELVVDRKYKLFDGSSDEAWTYSSGWSKTNTNVFFSNIVIEDAYFPTHEIVSITNCNRFEGVSRTALYNADINVVSFSGDFTKGRFTVRILKSTASSLEDFKTWIASNNIEIIYELSTPYTLQLTPAQLKLFKDVNNLNSSDYTTLTVTYHSNSIASLAPATDTTDGLLSAIDKRALDRTEEIIEGNPIQFETESVQVAKSTIVDLEPIQDLHGYSKPWVGGAGKNKLPLDVAIMKSQNTAWTWDGDTATYRSGTVTILTDNDNNVIGIKVNGAFTDVCNFRLTVTGNLGLNGYLLSGTNGDAKVQAYDDTLSTNVGDVGEGVLIPTNFSNYRAYIGLLAKNYNNVLVYPQCENNSSKTTFEPYTNIASISGRSEVDILGCGKNLAELDNVTLVNGSFINGVFTNTNTDTKSPFNLYVYTYKDNVILYSSVWNINISSSGRKTFTMDLNYDYDYLYIKHNGSTRDIGIKIPMKYKGNVTLSLTFDSCDPTTIGGIVIRDIMINAGSQATPYSPYIESTSLQIQLGQTVYGGQLDVENGVLVVDKVNVDLGDLNWDDLGTAVSGAARFKTTLTNKPVRSDLTNGSTSYCSHYDLLSDGGTYTANKDGYTISTTDIVFFVDAYKTSSTSAFKTAMSGVQVVYTLQDEYKTTISLTPEQVKLLQGVNTITTNADNITLTYRNGSVATLNDLESLYAKLKAYIDSLHSS